MARMTLTLRLATLALGAAAGLAQADGLLNGGFESGAANGWRTGQGNRSGHLTSAIQPGDFLPGGSLYEGPSTHSAIVPAGAVDPALGAALGSTVYEGNYSYRIEDTTLSGYASVLTQSVSAYAAPNIFFAWKAVLENGFHHDLASAAMIITLRDDSSGTELLRREYKAGGADPRFSQLGEVFYTAAWQIEQLPIDPGLAGHDFSVSVLAADCYYSGHFGYAYVDGFGAVSPVPEPATAATLLAGLGLLGAVARRKKRAPAR